jgi:ribosome biogenesis SPOUT family RNA methylase Rps3
MNKTFIIEHLDQKMWKWSLLEYAHISSIVGRKNLRFTSIKSGAGRLRKLGRVFSKKTSQLGLNQKKTCILDSTGKKTLEPKDAEKFDYFVFGGVLGDWPEADKSLTLVRSFPRATVRNLGTTQMSTDTAVLVAKKIISGTEIDKIQFIDRIQIPIRNLESIELPYRYVLRKRKPVLPKGLVQMLKSQKTF